VTGLLPGINFITSWIDKKVSWNYFFSSWVVFYNILVEAIYSDVLPNDRLLFLETSMAFLKRPNGLA
jgi:hypothetical protein